MWKIATSFVHWPARLLASFTSRIHGCKTPPTKFCAVLKLPILKRRRPKRRPRLIIMSKGAARPKAVSRRTVQSPKLGVHLSSLSKRGHPFPGAQPLQMILEDDSRLVGAG